MYHPSGISTGINKKVIGMMKSETGERHIEEFVGLRAKLYAYKMAEDGKEEKKCKGIKKTTIKKEITFDNYKECLFSGEKQCRGMNVFRSRLHEIMEQVPMYHSRSMNYTQHQLLPSIGHNTRFCMLQKRFLARLCLR